ncbi:MAG: IS256 family transposase [Caldilineaceae bacterium]
MIQQELGKAESIDDFFGKEGIFARLFAETLETMLEAELSDELGYERYEAKGRNSGNNRNGKRSKRLRTSAGDTEISVPRDRNGQFRSKLLKRYEKNTNEIEEKVVTLYAKGNSTRDIQETLADLYGIDVSASTISAITDKVWPLVEAWQSRPLEAIYAIAYLDAMYVKLRRKGRVENVAVYSVLAVDLEGRRDVLGHWIGDGAEGANFWLSVVTDLRNRGVDDIFIACVDGLSGFSDAIHSVFPQTQIQRCIVHQVRNSLKYVPWKERKAFAADLRQIYQAPTREQAETELLRLGEVWGDQYTIAVRSWENNWPELATMFDYTPEIRRLIYTTNSVESYHSRLRKVVKTKSSFPTPEAARKLLYLVTANVTRKWTGPVRDWAKILGQLAIRFEDRMQIP